MITERGWRASTKHPHFLLGFYFQPKQQVLCRWKSLSDLDKSYQSINTCWKAKFTKAKVLTIKHFSEETCREKLFPTTCSLNIHRRVGSFIHNTSLVQVFQKVIWNYYTVQQCQYSGFSYCCLPLADSHIPWSPTFCTGGSRNKHYLRECLEA